MKNKLVVNSAVLLIALKEVSKAIEKNPAVPIIESFLFRVSAGILTVSATDLDNTFRLSMPIEAANGVEFSAVVPPDIAKYLQKLGEHPIEIVYQPENYSIEAFEIDTETPWNLETGYKVTGRAKYSGENPEEFPREPQTNFTLWSLTSDLFKEFKDLLNYSSSDQLRPAMTGICFIQYMGAFNMVATDAHRLKTVTVPELSRPCEWNTETFRAYQKETEVKIRKFSKLDLPVADRYAARLQTILDDAEKRNTIQHFILPNKAAAILASLKFGTAKKPEVQSVSVSMSESEQHQYPSAIRSQYVSFKFKYMAFNAEVIARIIDEKYPQYWNVIPDNSVTRYTTEKDRFLKVVDKAELFANRTTHQIRLSLNGKNKISAEDLDFSNEYSAEVGGSYEGEPIEIGFNAKLLRETVKSFGDTFTLEMVASNKPAVIREGNSLALVMPIMLNEYAN